MKISLINVAIFFSIVGIYFLAAQFLTLLSLLVSLLGFLLNFIYFRVFKIDKIGIIIFANYLYWLISGLCVGSYTILSFANLSFYDGDARIILSYIPLLFFCVSNSNISNINFCLKIIRILSILSFVLFLVWFPTKVAFLSEGQAHNFAGFLTSHTGAGTFFGFLSVVLFFQGYTAKSRYDLILSFLMLIATLATGSRATLVGLVVVALWYVLTNFKVKNLFYIAIISSLLIIIMPIVAQHTFNRTSAIIDAETLSLIADQIKIGESDTWQPGDEDRELAGGDVNVLSRIVFWSYAIHRFVQSPIVGIGWGRYNDLNVGFTGIPGLFYLATSGQSRFSAANAHNSYLMLLCESGLVGLFLLLFLWFSMYFMLGKGKRYFIQNPEISAYFTAAQGSLWFTLAAAMFGHSLAAPSVCMPVLAFIGNGLSFYRTTLSENSKKNQLLTKKISGTNIL